MPQSSQTRFSRSFAALVGTCVLLCSGAVNAVPVTLHFSIQVDTRETHDGLFGFSTSNWLLDTAFSGEAFNLAYRLDTSSLSSTNSLFTIQGRVEDIPVPDSPLEDELDDVLTRWGPAEPIAALNLAQHVNISDFTKDIALGIDAFDARYNHPDPFRSTEQMRWGMQLRHQVVGELFTDQQHVDGYLMTAADMAGYLQQLAEDRTQFKFLLFSDQVQGTFSDYTSGRSYMEGVRYTGIATLTPAAAVPLPATLWLIVAGLVVIRMRAR